MEATAIKFGGTYKIRQSDLLGIPACTVQVVERRGSEFFSVLLPTGKRETVHASDLTEAA